MEVGKDTKFTLSIETGISILVTVGMIIGMWYSLQAEIELAKELPEPEVSRMEYDLKILIRDSILNTEGKVDKLEEKVDDIKEDTRAITETLIDMNNKIMRFTDEQQIYIILGINALLITILAVLTISQLR